MPAQTLGSITVHTYDLPQAEFDPVQAPAEDLRRYGFPQRPDPVTESRAHALWVTALRRVHGFTYLVPEFHSTPNHFHGPIQRTEPGTQPLSTATAHNWSGTEATVGGGDAFYWLFGKWTVPNVSAAPLGLTELQHSSAWLGIDGDGSESSDIMQAGTESDTDGNCYAWFEWYPAPENVITNLPVAFGDAVMLNMFAVDSTTASIFFANLTRAAVVQFSFTAPAGTTLTGNCAEVILERPTVNGNLAQLPRYGFIYFNDVVTMTRKGQIFPMGIANDIIMINDAGTQISQPELESGDSDSFVCNYTGP